MYYSKKKPNIYIYIIQRISFVIYFWWDGLIHDETTSWLIGWGCPVVSELGKQINLIIIVLASTGKSLKTK